MTKEKEALFPVCRQENRYFLPPLPYDYAALAPVISPEIMRLHHQKHHATYVQNLNVALEKWEAASKEGNLPLLIETQNLIRFNGGGHRNHALFWGSLAPIEQGGGVIDPSSPLFEALVARFGSFESFWEQLEKLALSVQGSGWAWLLLSPSKELMFAQTANQDTIAPSEGIPLLGIDLWEHAYYLQYENRRGEYLKNIHRVVNWQMVTARFVHARAC